MKITAVTDANKLRKRMEEFRQITGKEIGESLKAHARLACMNLMYRTQPFGDAAKAEAAGLSATSKDIDKVYYRQNSEALYGQVSNIAIRWYEAKEARNTEREAKALRERRFSDVKPRKSKSDRIRDFRARFKNYQDSGNTTAIGDIVKDMKFKNVLFDTFDPSYHKRSRDPKTGRVKGKVERVLVLGADSELNDYYNKKMDLVGFSKAGWVKCAEAIPIKGRVSSNTREAPAWVKRNLGRAMGNIQNNADNNLKNPHVLMTNATPWASQIIPPKEAKRALDDAADNYQTYMTTYIAETLKKQRLARSA